MQDQASIQDQASTQEQAATQEQAQLTTTASAAAGPARSSPMPGSYVLVVPGGGTGHPGAADALDCFLTAARTLAGSGIDTVFVGPVPAPATANVDTTAIDSDNATAAAVNAIATATSTNCVTTRATAPESRLHTPGALPQNELARLLDGARLVITNGGSTLLQALACGRPCIAAAIAGDQAERIRRCAAAGVALRAPLAAAALSDAAVSLLRDPTALDALAVRARALDLADGVAVALQALAPWLDAV